MTCSSCGQENEQGASFCESCGSRLVQAQAPPPPPPPLPQATSTPPARPVAVAQPSSPPAPAVTPPVAVAEPAKRTVRMAVLAIMGLLASGGGAYYLGFLGGDALIARLVATPLPPESYEGWRLDAAPHTVAADDPDPGEVGTVQAHFGRGTSISGLVFTVFETPAQARASFDESATFGQEIATLQRRFDLPSGTAVSCLGGAVCHAIVGRTVIFVQRDGGTVDGMKTTIESLAAHVSRLDR